MYMEIGYVCDVQAFNGINVEGLGWATLPANSDR